MKKFITLLGLFLLTALWGCLEITNESTIQQDGSGVYTRNVDMSAMITILKGMGGSDSTEMQKVNTDTLIRLASLKDSLTNLTEQEKRILEKGSLKVKVNMQEEKFFLNFSFPFSNTEDLSVINNLMNKSGNKILSNQIENLVPDENNKDNSALNAEGGKEDPPDLDGYFIFTFEKGKFTKKLNKEKYATVNDDKGMKSLQEMGQMGAPMKIKTIFNLPTAVKKTTGEGVQISADRKKITIEASIDDFFENPSKLEYEIEY
jgi:hypothetical protein